MLYLCKQRLNKIFIPTTEANVSAFASWLSDYSYLALNRGFTISSINGGSVEFPKYDPLSNVEWYSAVERGNNTIISGNITVDVIRDCGIENETLLFEQIEEPVFLQHVAEDNMVKFTSGVEIEMDLLSIEDLMSVAYENLCGFCGCGDSKINHDSMFTILRKLNTGDKLTGNDQIVKLALMETGIYDPVKGMSDHGKLALEIMEYLQCSN